MEPGRTSKDAFWLRTRKHLTLPMPQNTNSPALARPGIMPTSENRVFSKQTYGTGKNLKRCLLAPNTEVSYPADAVDSEFYGFPQNDTFLQCRFPGIKITLYPEPCADVSYPASRRLTRTDSSASPAARSSFWVTTWAGAFSLTGVKFQIPKIPASIIRSAVS